MCRKIFRDSNKLFTHMSMSPICQAEYVLPDAKPEPQPAAVPERAPVARSKTMVSSSKRTKTIQSVTNFLAARNQHVQARQTLSRWKCPSKPRRIPQNANRLIEVMTKASKAFFETKVNCQSCGKFFNSKDSLLAHMSTHYIAPNALERALKCHICHEEFVDEFVRSVHSRNGQCKQRCAKCVQGFDDLPQLTRHLARHQVTRTQSKM
ncbi:zinc finger protein 774-like [Tigriopus californicus]|uniref:zinc finger protein 774-like n=1 Tax=Tigriopus californicus TaxID=6832 RepID=UPI0027DA00EE|nr:zinc finger protein 774-like [Tigriopus californicus]